MRIGGRSSSAQYQYTLQSDDLDELQRWAPKVLDDNAQDRTSLTDVNTRPAEQRPAKPSGRSTATPPSRLGITPQAIDDTLYDAFGQRQVSTMYTPLNQYHVVLEVEPRVLAEPRRARPDLRARGQRAAGAAQRVHAFRAAHHAARRQPPGAVPVGHALVQPGARASRSATRSTRSIEAEAQTSACRPTIHGDLPGHGAGVPGFARERAAADRWPRSSPSTSCSACSTRATSTRSRSSRRCRRRASARCWRCCSSTPT